MRGMLAKRDQWVSGAAVRGEMREKGPLRLLDGAGSMGMGLAEVPSCIQPSRVGEPKRQMCCLFRMRLLAKMEKG